MKLRVVCVFLLSFSMIDADEPQYRESLVDRLSSGMKLAQNLLGSESVALKVAEFVVKAFQTANNPPKRRPSPITNVPDEEHYEDDQPTHVNEIPSPMAPLRHLVRLFGLQPKQISAVAVNALVFVAQMISTFLAGPQSPAKPYRSEDPTTWILNKNSKSLQDLISAAKNESLPDSIEDLIKEQGTEEETSCIRLLICKITPYVNKMQKAVFGKSEPINEKSEKIRGAANMYRHLPSSEEINKRSDICERRHSNCNLND